MKFSVILTTYNRSQYITRAIDSILNQSYKDWELVIVDDCSQDSTFEMARACIDKDNRCKVLRNQMNLGVSATRNVGINNTSGDYILFLDDDDVYERHALEILADTISLNYQPDVICYGCQWWKPSLKLVTGG